MRTGWARLAAAAALVIGAAGCSSNREHRAANGRADTATTSGSTTTGTTGRMLSVAQLAANPSPYEGQRVTVRANVGGSVGQTAFTLMDASGSSVGTAADGAAGSARAKGGTAIGPDTQQTLLVLSPSGAPSDRQDLTISGTLRKFTSTEDLRRDAPWLAPSDSPGGLEPYHNRPVIVADSIRTADGRELLTASSALPAGSGEPGGTSSSGSSSSTGSGSGGSDRP